VKPSYQAESQPYPHVVDVYDYGGMDGITNYPEIGISTGDGPDKVAMNDFGNPILFSVGTGAGNDNFSVDGAYPFYADLGPGDDQAHLGNSVSDSVSPCPKIGRTVYGGDGNDTTDTLNRFRDTVDCGNGLDIFIGTPGLDSTTGCEPLP
jgi:hypothetical protein